MMACSAAKADSLRPAVDLYQGVMYQTLRAHLPPTDDDLVIMILSAEHGLIFGHEEIEPYDRELTAERADELIATGFPDDIYFDGPTFDRVFLAGGAEYRRVMRAYIVAMREFGQVEPGATVEEVDGGIGQQRHQLGKFLRSVVPLEQAEERVA